MRAFRLFAGSIIALGLLGTAWGQRAQVQIQKRGEAPLLAGESVDKLKLNAQQKEKFDKIETTYKDELKAAQEKIRADIKGGDREKAREAFQKLQTESQKLRTDALAKVEAALDAEQKKTLEQIKQDQPRRAPQPGVPFGVIRPLGNQVGGQVLPAPAQEKLKLTDEQKKRIDELQKDLESKIINVLTDEQKKQYEELKKGIQPRTRRPGTDN